MKDCTNDGYWPDYPRITLSELAVLKLDAASAQKFYWQFTWRPVAAGILGATVMGGTPIAHGAGLIDGFTFTVAYVAVVVLAFVEGRRWQRAKARARPTSSMSGHVMEPFIIANLETPNHYELAYIDRPTGTYFRKVFAQMD